MSFRTSLFYDASETQEYDGTDDVVGNLVAATVDGEQITERELLVMGSFLVFAGFDTTRNQLGLLMQTFAERQDQWHLLQEQPEALQGAQEVLRREAGISKTLHEVYSCLGR